MYVTDALWMRGRGEAPAERWADVALGRQEADGPRDYGQTIASLKESGLVV